MADMKASKKFEAAMDKIAKGLEKGGTLKVGFLAGATYPDGTPVAMVAAIQNFGAPRAGIPPRPFFGDLIEEKSSEWPKAIAGLLRENSDVEKTLTLAGEAIAGQLREAITKYSGTPLKPATIKRKGFDKQLVDTGHMLQSVGYEVKTD